MKIIKAHFMRMSQVLVNELPKTVGAYVIWSGKAVARPTYIGEGVILSRLAEHAKKFALPWEGVVAILGDGSRKQHKTDAEVVEALLLFCAEEVDRYPTRNTAVGKRAKAERVFKKHGVLRIRVTGQDPLLEPERPPMKGKKVIVMRRDGARHFGVKVPWNLRPLGEG